MALSGLADVTPDLSVPPVPHPKVNEDEAQLAQLRFRALGSGQLFHVECLNMVKSRMGTPEVRMTVVAGV